MNKKDILLEKNRKQRKTKVANSVTYTTGDPDLNIAFFNKRMGTNFEADKLEFTQSDLDGSTDLTVEVCDGDDCGALTEAKRETKRYYVRPQNIFCANKSDVLRALTEIDTENCSVYTLKNLEDHDDVHLLTNKDIIYYYDNEVLYDKNHVKIMDYKLSIKNEEERKNFASDADDISDSTFRDEYEDRLTDRTLDLQESFGGPQCGWCIDVHPEGRRSEYSSEITATNIFNKLRDLVKAEPYSYKPEYTVILFKNISEDEVEEIDKFCAGELTKELLEPKEDKVEDNQLYLPISNYEENDEPIYEDDFDAIEYPGINLDDDNVFKQDFESRNVFGEAVERKICCICGEEYEGYGNNPAPVRDSGKCCDGCNLKFVVPARIDQNKHD